MSWEPGAEPDGEPFDLEHNGPRASPVELDCRGCNVPTVVIEQLDHGTHDTQQPLQRLETPQKPQVERQRTPEKPKFAHVDPDLPDATAPCFDDEDPARAAHGARFCAEGDAQSSGVGADNHRSEEWEWQTFWRTLSRQHHPNFHAEIFRRHTSMDGQSFIIYSFTCHPPDTD